MAKKSFRNTMAVLLLTLLSQLALADELSNRAKTLLDQGKAGEAFQLLDPVEGARAGDPAFDLLFGISAVEAGQHTRGVFALERVLAVQPNNARARAEIARAYLALGETTTAKQEFETVQKQGVPPEVSATIDRFLDAVDRLDSVSRATVRGFVEGASGYDSNVNVGSNKSSVAIPGFGGLPFTLTDDSKANAAWFATLGGGLTVRSPITSELALVGGLSGALRNNFGVSQFDTVTADAYAGVVLTRDKNIFSLNAQFNQYDLASDRYRTAAGLSGQWQYNWDARNQSSAFVQYSDLRYPMQAVQNADRWLAGGAFAHAYREGEVTFASGYWVGQRPQDGGSPWLGFDGLGIRAGGQMNFDAKTVLFAGGSVEYRRYAAEDPSFLKTRKDTQYDLALGANYTPARNWKVTPRISYTLNESNVELNKYNRETVSVTVRRDF
ncbi:surface lipoprotein assembly modifier [Propionivibrio sp.]|uniref:surface lipoprotein assembly modifier n=1 Tax=Propionivibrio sp. TaxID=2212460 RepID=UPI0026021285|nr:surface lipoprotein assembly modifier [Propionivibrio sp.]